MHLRNYVNKYSMEMKSEWRHRNVGKFENFYTLILTKMSQKGFLHRNSQFNTSHFVVEKFEKQY